MTEIMRRDPRMVSNAIHLFIDAWPSGWMKAIMDCERNPKPAYFAYKNALEPLMISLRSDRFTYFEGEKISIEAYISNDFDLSFKDYEVCFELYSGNKKLKHSELKTNIKACDVTYVSNAEFSIESVDDRQKFTLRAVLTDENKNVVDYNDFEFEVFSDVEVHENDDVVIIDNLEPGEYEIAGETVKVYQTWMNGRNFVSRDTGHESVKGFMPDDFKYWYDKNLDRITPVTDKTFKADGFEAILKCQNYDETEKLSDHHAVAQKMYEGKKYVISTLDIRCENPVAKRLKKRLYEI